MDEAAIKDKAFAAKNVAGKFPVLELPSGEMVFESGTISKHFARCAPASGLLGQSVFETAKVDEWVSFTQGKVWPAMMPVIRAALGHTLVKADAFQAGVK